MTGRPSQGPPYRASKHSTAQDKRIRFQKSFSWSRRSGKRVRIFNGISRIRRGPGRQQLPLLRESPRTADCELAVTARIEEDAVTTVKATRDEKIVAALERIAQAWPDLFEWGGGQRILL